MFRLFRRMRSPTRPARPLLSPEEIETLMHGPVAERPTITVLGDDDVVGFTPAQPPAQSLSQPPLRRA